MFDFTELRTMALLSTLFIPPLYWLVINNLSDKINKSKAPENQYKYTPSFVLSKLKGLEVVSLLCIILFIILLFQGDLQPTDFILLLDVLWYLLLHKKIKEIKTMV